MTPVTSPGRSIPHRRRRALSSRAGTVSLSVVDRLAARGERGRPVRRGDGDHDARLADLDPPDPVVDRDVEQRRAARAARRRCAPSPPRPCPRTPRTRAGRRPGRASGLRVVPTNVAIAPASSRRDLGDDRARARAARRRAGSRRRRRAGSRATSSPSASGVAALDVRAVDRVEEARAARRRARARARRRRPTAPSGELERPLPRTRRSRRAAKSLTALSRDGGYPAVGARRPCHVTCLAMTALIPRANLNDQVYETLRQRILTREHGPGREAQPARARGRARRLAQPGPPRAHPARLGGPPHA